MRRWTLLLIPHDSESPKSISVTERAVRVFATAGVALALVALIGVGSVVAQLGHLRIPRSDGGAASPKVQELRERVGALRGALDTLRREDARLRATVGAPRADTTTLLRRVLARLPWFLRDPRPAPTTLPAVVAVPDTSRQVEVATGTAVVADSLLAHAEDLAAGYRGIAPGGLRLDTLEILSLRPESLSVAATAAVPRITRTGRTVEWMPGRSGALLAGFNAEVVRADEASPGVWKLDLRGGGGLVGSIRAPGRPTVRLGEQVVADQPVMLIGTSPVTPGTRASAVYELRRNGMSLDPTYVRSSSAAGALRVP